MKVYPTVFVHTPQPHPVLPRGLWATPDGFNGWFVDHMNGRAGHVFPRIVTDVGGSWYGRLVRQPAVRFDVDGSLIFPLWRALAHVCRCDLSEIRFEGAS